MSHLSSPRAAYLRELSEDRSAARALYALRRWVVAMLCSWLLFVASQAVFLASASGAVSSSHIMLLLCLLAAVFGALVAVRYGVKLWQPRPRWLVPAKYRLIGVLLAATYTFWLSLLTFVMGEMKVAVWPLLLSGLPRAAAIMAVLLMVLNALSALNDAAIVRFHSRVLRGRWENLSSRSLPLMSLILDLLLLLAVGAIYAATSNSASLVSLLLLTASLPLQLRYVWHSFFRRSLPSSWHVSMQLLAFQHVVLYTSVFFLNLTQVLLDVSEQPFWATVLAQPVVSVVAVIAAMLSYSVLLLATLRMVNKHGLMTHGAALLGEGVDEERAVTDGDRLESSDEGRDGVLLPR
eukprot:PLAT8562.1.p1 GENE.PLAT8562.1~~PLAT8562.1.p1  ORF type:complete len:350 (-),score=135.35 PLAT8562.1:31-1080(-)